MMIFIGLVLLIVYLIGTINGGWFTETIKEGEGLTKEKLESISDEDEQIGYALKVFIKVSVALVFAIFMTILTLIFLIGALSVDVILVPTIILLAIFVLKFVRVGTSKKYREKVNNRTEKQKKTRARISNSIYVLYVLYILILLIV